MKISICIPQYNRIDYLLKSLSYIQLQRYNNIEVVISDDCSSDDTETRISDLMHKYRFPIIYKRNDRNKGFDFNYRQSIELSTGDYSLVIGNDDSLYGADAIEYLVEFLRKHDYPEIGFCNCVEERRNNELMKRAHKTGVLGAGPDIALKYYSVFSFVGGLIYRKSTFDIYNTNKHDGSVYSQMYLGTHMIAKGERLFSISKPLVVKDLLVDGIFRSSYRDRIAKRWSDYRKVDGGLPSVIHVISCSFRDAGVLNDSTSYQIFKRIYSITYPFWIQDYKSNGALPEAIGLIHGLNPSLNEEFKRLNISSKVRIYLRYFFSSIVSLLMPTKLFQRLQTRLYEMMKK